MCGIVGYVGNKAACPVLIAGLRKLEYRGYDSAGVALWQEGDFLLRRCRGKIVALEERLGGEALPGTLGVGHTRWATHGRPSDENAHPHRAGAFVVVHNGIIENHRQLRQQLTRQGAVFQTETDSEVVPQLIDFHYRRQGQKNPLLAIRQALRELRGSYALAILCRDEGQTLYAAKNASPLIIGLGDGENLVASDVPAFLAHTRRTLVLEDGDVAQIRREGVVLGDLDGHPVRRPLREVQWTPLMAEKEGYRHFMLKEIHEQPRALRETMRGRIDLEQGRVLIGEALPPGLVAARLQSLYLVACGTSYHAAMVGKLLIEKLARLRVEVELASEFRYRDPVLDGEALFVAISQSGETADTLAALEEVKRRGLPTLAVCNVVDSSIARKAGGVLYTQAGPEIGVASTKAFTAQLTAMYLLALYLAEQRNTLSAEQRRQILDSLQQLPGILEKGLEAEGEVEEVAKHYFQSQDFLYLGRGLLYPVALEGALKLKEISYIHAEGYAGGEIKHGPIALVDEQVPVVVLAPRGALLEKMVSNIQEVRSRGGRVIALCTAGDPEVEELAEQIIALPETDELFAPLVVTVPLQLLAYHVAVLRGTDVDQPRNLAKSVTVE